MDDVVEIDVDALEQAASEADAAADDVQEGYTGDYPELAAHVKSGEPLTDDELDLVADIAIDVLRTILSHFGADKCSIDEYDGDDGELILDVSGGDLAVLIGRHGRTLDALQTLVSLMVSRKLGFRFPLVVDVEGYKGRRKSKLAGMARNAAKRALRTGGSVKLPPMNAYERRLVHLALRDYDDVATHSEGVDPDRFVIVVPVEVD